MRQGGAKVRQVTDLAFNGRRMLPPPWSFRTITSRAWVPLRARRSWRLLGMFGRSGARRAETARLRPRGPWFVNLKALSRADVRCWESVRAVKGSAPAGRAGRICRAESIGAAGPGRRSGCGTIGGGRHHVRAVLTVAVDRPRRRDPTPVDPVNGRGPAPSRAARLLPAPGGGRQSQKACAHRRHAQARRRAQRPRPGRPAMARTTISLTSRQSLAPFPTCHPAKKLLFRPVRIPAYFICFLIKLPLIVTTINSSTILMHLTCSII
jgi:hypothetical protein